MAGIKINPETGDEKGGFLSLFGIVFIALCIAGDLCARYDISLATDNAFLNALIFAAVLAFSVTMLIAIVTIAHRIGIALLHWGSTAVTFIAHVADGAVTLAAERGRLLLAAILRLPLTAAAALYRSVHGIWIAPIAERRRQRAELRRLWEEVREDYPRYEDFLRAFRGEAGPNEGASAAGDAEAARPVDQFAAACRTLGLSEDGTFTAAALKARYTELMKALHPDVIGPNIFATQLNEARALIKARKGWK
jgi:hypothetical protein